MRVRPLRADDEPTVRSLQRVLEYTDADIVSAAVTGPFIGRVAIEPTTTGEAVVGYAIALPGSEVTLSELVVAPDSRRDGYGEALVDALADATGADRLVVTTPAENESARQFYESLGFALEERLESFYDDGTDALRLARRE